MQNITSWRVPQIERFLGPTWGPPGSCRPQMGPKLAPLILLSGSSSVPFQCRIRHLTVRFLKVLIFRATACYIAHIALKFDRRLDDSAFKSDRWTFNTDLAPQRWSDYKTSYSILNHLPPPLSIISVSNVICFVSPWYEKSDVAYHQTKKPQTCTHLGTYS